MAASKKLNMGKWIVEFSDKELFSLKDDGKLIDSIDAFIEEYGGKLVLWPKEHEQELVERGLIDMKKLKENAIDKKIEEDIGWMTSTYATTGFGHFFDDDDEFYFKKHKIAAYDNKDKQLSKEEAAKKQREYEEWRRQYEARRATEKEAASKEPRLAIRLALPPEYERVPLNDTFFTSSEKEGQYDQVNVGPEYPHYPNAPFNIFTVYGPLSQLKKIFNHYGRMFFAYDAKGNKVKPNPDSISKCLVDANGNDQTFYMVADSINESKIKKLYTKKQITEAIAYWEKQLNLGNYKRVNESVEGTAKMALKKMAQQLRASIGQTPSSKALFDGTPEFLHVDETTYKGKLRDSIETIDSNGKPWQWVNVDGTFVNVGKVTVEKFYDIVNYGHLKQGAYVFNVPSNASLDDMKKLKEWSKYTHTSGADDALLAEVLQIIKGNSVSEKTFANLVNSAKDIAHKVKQANMRQSQWLNNQTFKLSFSKGMKAKPPYAYDDSQTDGEVLGWICSALGLNNANELYNELVSSKKEEREGNQTAVDDWDMFYASEQDMISEEDFLKRLVESIESKLEDERDEDGISRVDESTLSSWVYDCAEKIVDQAIQDFDYRDYQTRRGRDDIYY